MYSLRGFRISNRADFLSPVIRVRDRISKEPINISDAEITVKVKDKRSGRDLITKVIGDGVMLVSSDEGQFQFGFKVQELRLRSAGTYTLGIKIDVNGMIHDPVIGDVTIIEGV